MYKKKKNPFKMWTVYIGMLIGSAFGRYVLTYFLPATEKFFNLGAYRYDFIILIGIAIGIVFGFLLGWILYRYQTLFGVIITFMVVAIIIFLIIQGIIKLPVQETMDIINQTAERSGALKQELIEGNI